MSNSKHSINLLAEIALMAALAFIISRLPNAVFGFIIIEVAVIPILILSLRRGLIPGIMGGIIWGLLIIVIGNAQILTFAQALLEYIIAPMALGLAGLFQQKSNSPKIIPVISGIALAILVKYFFHFIAGIIFWGSFAWQGFSAFLYSLIVNGVSGLLTVLVSAIILGILVQKFPKIFIAKDN